MTDATPAPSPGAPMLAFTNVSRSFGGLVAVRDCTFQLVRGELVGLVGPNGAGKSTLFNLACGYLSPTSGSIEVAGDDIDGARPDQLARGGMGRTFQTPSYFPELSVRDNVLVGTSDPRPLLSGITGRWRRTESAQAEAARVLLERVGLAARADDDAGDLSGGELRMLEVARQLMTKPDILMLDEPTAGVAPQLQTQLEALIRSVNADGTTVLVVEHNLGFLLGLVDRVLCMSAGEIIADGPPDEIRHDSTVIAAYLGDHGDVA